MTTYDIVHLVIHASGGKIQGRTKLQKIAYFVGVLTGDLRNLGYRAHFYGPYSPDVADAVEELQGLKFLEQIALPYGAPDDQGFEKIRYDYALTAEGTQVAEEKVAQWHEDWEAIHAATRRLASSKVQDYVRLAIAAKTHLLSGQAGTALAEDVLKVKTAEHGWKTFTETQYAEAIEFLATIKNADLASNPSRTV